MKHPLFQIQNLTDEQLRNLVGQLNRFVDKTNKYSDENDTAHLFNASSVLVNKDGDVLTSSGGSVLIA